jgi:comEA protein
MMVIFLVMTFLVGGGIRLYEAYFVTPSDEELETKYNYAASDSEFNKRSADIRQILRSDTSEPKAFQIGRVNINTATKDDLMMLPGVGGATAKRIILYRQDRGPFKGIEDLKNVKGIGEKKFQQLKRFISVK